MLQAASAYCRKQNDAHQRSAFKWGADDRGTASGRAEMWLRKAIEGKEKEVACAPNGAQEKTLNGQAWHLGTKIASLRGRGFQITTVLAEEGRRPLIEAGLSMTNYDPRWPWLEYEVEAKVDEALEAGLQRPIATLPHDLWPDTPLASALANGKKAPSDSVDPPEPGSFEADDDKSAAAQTAQNESRWDEAQSPLDDEPEPLLPDLERATPFPLEALGTIIGHAAKALVQFTQAPDAIAGQTILSGLNVVAQRHIDVLVPQGGDNPRVGSVQPVSCFFLTVATTGERKSSCEKIALKEHRIFELDAQQAYQGELEAFKRKKAV